MPKGYLINGHDLDPEFYNTCIFGIIPLPGRVSPFKMYLLGDVFLRNYYSVYDYHSQSVRLGVNIHAKDYASMRERDLDWESFYIYILVIGIICLILAWLY